MKKSSTRVLVPGEGASIDGDFILHGLGEVTVGVRNGRTVAVRANVPGKIFERVRKAPATGRFLSTGWKADTAALAASIAQLPPEVTHIAFVKDVPKIQRPLIATADTRERRTNDELVAVIGLEAGKRIQTNASVFSPRVEEVTTGSGETYTQVPLRCRTDYAAKDGAMVATIEVDRVRKAVAMRLPDGATLPDVVSFEAALDAVDTAPAAPAPAQAEGEVE